MKSTFKFAGNLMSTALLAGLAACGGGGDDGAPVAVAAPVVVPTTDAADKYVGAWKTGCSGPATITATGAVVSSYSTVTITKVSATSYAVVGGNVSFSGAGCTGTGTPVPGEGGSNTFTLVGTKTIGSATVDKVTAPSGSSTVKNVAYVNPAGPTLQFGDSGGGNDSDGYPNALQTNRYSK